MAKKVMEIVVCDLCKRDRPAVTQVTLDVCNQHKGQIERQGVETGTLEVCPECKRTFRGTQGLAVHRRRAHGVVSMRPRSSRKPRRKVKAHG